MMVRWEIWRFAAVPVGGVGWSEWLRVVLSLLTRPRRYQPLVGRKTDLIQQKEGVEEEWEMLGASGDAGEVSSDAEERGGYAGVDAGINEEQRTHRWMVTLGIWTHILMDNGKANDLVMILVFVVVVVVDVLEYQCKE
jgi:hypothetical protein